MELAASYAPQNQYCYAMDANAHWMFRTRMQALTNCFPNVYLIQKEYAMDGRGKNMGYSHLECMRKLIDYKWKYLILLQVGIFEVIIQYVLFWCRKLEVDQLSTGFLLNYYVQHY
jgi:hypothetical protein